MPELPEVEITRRKIEPHLKGRTLLELRHDPSHRYRDTERAAGRVVSHLSRRGKYLIVHLEPQPGGEEGEAGQGGGPLELIVHLGMTGGFRFDETPHTRVTVRTDGGTLYFQDARRFGKMVVVAPGEYAAMPTLAAMGPEPLSDDFDQEAFVAEVTGGAKMIKPWLLSQEPVAGVGNIYADESLWRAQLHPAQRRLLSDEARRLYAAIRETMFEAVEAGGSTLSDGTYQQPDGLAGLFQTRHNAYDRAGKPCPRCGVSIVKTVLAQRGTHFCPHCQVLEERK